MNKELVNNKNIYNKNNKLITKNVINLILKENGIKEECENLKIWQESLTLSNYAYNEDNLKRKNQFNYHIKYAGITKNEIEIFDKFQILNTEKEKIKLLNNNIDLYNKYNLDRTDKIDESIVEIQIKSNEKLEWFGNRFLQTVTALYLRYKFPKANEIFLTNMQINKLLTSEILGKMALKINLDKYILLSNYFEKNRNGRLNPKYLKSVFTSFLTAIFVDVGKKNFGYGIYILFMFYKKVFEKCYDINDLILKNNDSKHLLIKYFHKKYNEEPVFKNIKEIEKDGFIYFEEGVYFKNKKITTGLALNKKDAQKLAAKKALEKYNVNIVEMVESGSQGYNRLNKYSYKILSNKKNKKIKDNDILKILKKYKIKNKINNLDKWQQCFVHKSYVKNKLVHTNLYEIEGCLPLFDNSSETYEWIGDRIIQSITSVYLMNRYPYETEDFYSKTQSKMVKKETLSQLSLKMGLGYFLIISEYIEKNNGRKDKSNLEDCFEALIGCFFLDLNKKDMIYGLNLTNTFLINIIEDELDFSGLISVNDDYKYMLMEYFHSKFNCLPEYRIIKIFFVTELLINNKIVENYVHIYNCKNTNKINSLKYNENKKKSYDYCFNKIKKTYKISNIDDLKKKYNRVYIKQKVNYLQGIYHDDKLIGKYKNYNKKIAEKMAAKNALEYFDIEIKTY